MEQEIKKCQNCKKEFTIEPEDFNFYEKIKVPPPTFCPECRLQQRMIFRNERTLYKRKCDAPGHFEDIISLFPGELNQKVYDHNYWWSDGWDAMFSFSLPLYFWKQSYGVSSIGLEREAAKAAFSNMENMTLWEVKEAYIAADAARRTYLL